MKVSEESKEVKEVKLKMETANMGLKQVEKEIV